MEVVLAVGIMALGVVTILGLLPHGMEMSRKTANELAENRIIDALVADSQAMEWTALEAQSRASSRNNRVFDDQGLEILSGSGEAAALISYVATVQVPTSDVRLPTNASSANANNNGAKGNLNLRRVTVKIASTTNRGFDFNAPPPGVAFKTFTQLVAKMR